MDAKTIVKRLGGPSKVASQLKSPRKRGHQLTRAAVSKWSRIPVEHCHAIARLSEGRFTPEKMRPDIFGRAA